jgi:hypothetical protein
MMFYRSRRALLLDTHYNIASNKSQPVFCVTAVRGVITRSDNMSPQHWLCWIEMCTRRDYSSEQLVSSKWRYIPGGDSKCHGLVPKTWSTRTRRRQTVSELKMVYKEVAMAYFVVLRWQTSVRIAGASGRHPNPGSP